MPSFAPIHASLSRLADRVAAGEVVFFVGAGASRDTEGNTRDVLIARLLARFEALHELIGMASGAAIKERVEDIYANLKQTFRIDPPYLQKDKVERFSRDYYLINDWMCSALNELLGLVEGLLRRKRFNREDFIVQLHLRERELFAAWCREAGQDEELTPGPGEFDLTGLLLLDVGPRVRGKALFLDTMGFTERAVMGGEPLAEHARDVMTASCGGLPEPKRLLERHHVLARLAREGLSQALITTNYDLLLESAYRLAGFEPLPARDLNGQGLPPTTFEFFDRVASAGQFFQRGPVARAPRIVKIHGCAENYRRLRNVNGVDRKKSWQSYLPAMVFTYREIQNWRQDAWSRDLLSTLLRTRTVVFCGYSLVDPVLHDTFRTVYEEMAASGTNRDLRPNEPPARLKSEPPGARAPAFFFGLQDRREFHGMQILRAASQAVGDASRLRDDHPNYLGFFPRHDEHFATLDELLTWLFHLVVRRRQRQMLASDLTRIATLMLEHPAPAAEVDIVLDRHNALCDAETRLARRWNTNRRAREAFVRTTGWTYRFHVGLLREFAIAEDALRYAEPGVRATDLRWPWYFPALDHPDWTAWAAVVEIALRRMIAAWRGDSHSWLDDSPWIRPSATEQPAVEFALNAEQPTPRLLTIMTAPGTQSRAPVVAGAYRSRPLWKLQPRSIPWLRPSEITRRTHRASHQPYGLTPTADVIWSWAWKEDTESLARNSDGWPVLTTVLGDDDD